MTTVVQSRGRRASRWLSPTGFVLAGLMLFLPFVAVSCDAPGGFGRAAAGGTTTYTGVTLVTGQAPNVSPADRLAPTATRRDDRLGAQPLAIALAVLIVGGLVGAIAIRPRLRRRATVTLVAAVAIVFIVANQVTTQALVQSRLREQLRSPMPAGKQASDFVHDQGGFWACLATLLALAIANAIGWFRLRDRPTLQARLDEESTVDLPAS